MEIYMWSTNQENYHGEFNCYSEREALLAAITDEGLEHGNEVWVSKMKKVEVPKFNEFMNADDIFDNADEFISDNCGNEDPMFQCLVSDEKSLMNYLELAWQKWNKDNPKVFRQYYMAIDPTKFEVDPEDVRAAKNG